MKTKEIIFISAAELFSSKGYKSVSVREICNKAGITKPVLYYYFEDKETLLKELIEENFRIGDQLKQKYFKSDNDFFDNLNAFPKIYKELLKNYRPFVLFSSFLNTMAIPENLQNKKIKRAKREMSEFRKFLQNGKDTGCVPEDTDIVALADTIIGSLLFLVLQNILLGFHKKDINKKIDNLFHLWKSNLLIDKQHLE